jgi:hypothetical protein
MVITSVSFAVVPLVLILSDDNDAVADGDDAANSACARNCYKKLEKKQPLRTTDMPILLFFLCIW